MNQLRVLHVYRTYYPDPPGGLQEAIRQITVATADSNIESRIFALSPFPEPQDILRPEARVTRCKSWAAPASCDLGGGSAIKRFSESANWADVINYHFPWPFADLLHFIVHPKAPAVMTYHSDIVRQRWLARAYSPFMRHMLRSMSAVVATSPAYARTSAVLSAPELSNRIRVIPLGIDERSYSQNCENEELQRFDLKDNVPFFLFIGVLRYYKGLHNLIQAAALIDAHVIIAGSGPEEASLQHQVLQLGLKNLFFAGQISDAEKVALLKQCCALVLPSHLRSEAYGMVLVEASMFCKPMISCEIGTGTSYVNIDGETGVVVPPDNPFELAVAMNRLAKDRKLVLQYGTAARVRYEDNFSGGALGRAYSNLYREVAKSQ